MSLQRVDELTQPPEIGRYYLVPCVETAHGPLPVLGSWHADPELYMPKHHYHYDIRFLDDKRIHYLGYGDPSRAMPFLRMEGPQVVWKRRKCRRVQGTFPQSQQAQNPFATMERQYERCRLNPDRPVCPHRGFDLTNTPVDEYGCRTCPLHGLRWNATTGEMVRRYPK